MANSDLEDILAGSPGYAVLDEPAAKRVLKSAGIATPRSRVISSAADLPGALVGMAYPMVAKLISPDAIHKSEVGGVKLHLKSEDQIHAAIFELEGMARSKSLRLSGFLIEEMASGQEIVIGGIADARFGPVLMLGLGGVFVEILRDVAFRICPLDRIDALEMIDDLKGAPLLRGARGTAPILEEALVQLILAVGGENGLLMAAGDRIAELDINPVIVDDKRALACDARIVLQHA